MTTAQRSTPTSLGIIAAFAVVYVVWGSTYLAIRYAIETMPPFLMAAVRFTVAGALLYAIMRWRGAGRPTFVQWRNAAIIGCLMLATANGLVCWSEQVVPSGIAALLVATVPLWLVALDWGLFRGPRPTLSIVAGLVIGLMGVYLLIGGSSLSGEPIDPWGAAGMLVACLAWALGSLLARRLELPRSTFQTTAMEMLGGGAVLIVIGSASGEWAEVDIAGVSWQSLVALVYLILFGSILALSSYVWLLTATTPARVGTYAYVNPVVAMTLGFLFKDEPLSARVVVAAAIILAAIVLITVARQAAPPVPQEPCRGAGARPRPTGPTFGAQPATCEVKEGC